MTTFNRRLIALERTAEQSEIDRIAALSVAEARREFTRLEHNRDAADVRRFVRHLSTKALEALSVSSPGSPWIAKLPNADLIALMDGRVIVGPLPPGLGYQ